MAGALALTAGGSAAGAPDPVLARAPGAPSSLLSARAAATHRFCLAADAGDAKVNLTWTPAASGKIFTFYEGTASGTGKPVKPDTITGASALVTGLTNGTTYYFWLAVGTSPTAVSNTALAIPVGMMAPIGPAPPARAVATHKVCLAADAGDKQVNLTWTPNVPGKIFTFYEGTASGTGKPVKPDTVTDAGALVTGLTNGTTYYFWLAVGTSPTAVSNTALAIPVGVPGPPAKLTATAGNAQVTLAWAAPASTGGLPVSGYMIYKGTSPGGETGPPVNGSPVNATGYTVTGLTNGTTYYFTVVAINAAGPGPPSGEASTVPVTVPGAPAGLTVIPGNAQVTLSWAAPASTGASPVTGYDIYTGTTADFNGRAPLATVTGTIATVTGLVNGTTYFFRVTAVNRVGEGPAAEAKAVPVTVPGAPAGLTVIPGNAQVTLSWAAPASTGGLPVSGYIIYKGTSPGGETGIPVNGSPVTGTGYTVTGLTNGTTYYFKVLALNAAGLSPLSEEASAALPPVVHSTGPSSTGPSSTGPSSTGPSSTGPSSTGPSSTGPSSTGPSSTGPSSTGPSSTGPAFGPPTGLIATAGDTQVRLSWTAPASAGGSPVVTYKIYVATTPGVPGRAADGSATSTTATVAHLSNGTVYYFMVTAVSTAGKEGPFSTQVSAEPTGSGTGTKVGLSSPIAPTQLIALLAAVAAMGAAALFTLITRRGRRGRRAQSPAHARPARSREPVAVPSDVRAVPDISRPDVLSVRDIGQEPTHTIRLEPHPGVASTTFKGRRP